jgi:hypothetical protein
VVEERETEREAMGRDPTAMWAVGGESGTAGEEKRETTKKRERQSTQRRSCSR